LTYLAEVVSIRQGGVHLASVISNDDQLAVTNDVHLSTDVTLTTHVVARTVDGLA